ncbi:MAG: carboxypeptidase-like regulatory domain-containing protein [Promethearchaeota archaeon]
MFNRKKIGTHNYIKFFFISVIISFILIPIVISDVKYNSNEGIIDTYPQLNDFSKNDYDAILSEEKYGLGTIKVTNIDFSQLKEGYFENNDTYPEIYEDYNLKYLNKTHLGMQFMDTTKSAIVDNIDENTSDNYQIAVKLNESIFFEYNNLTQGYLIYHPRLDPCELLQLFVNNGTNIFELEAGNNYTIDSFNNFVKFDYEKYFQEWQNTNFTMYFIWEYTLEINDWSLSQKSTKNLMIHEIEQNFTIDFNYEFTIAGQKFNESSANPGETTLADDIDIALTVDPFDKNSFINHTLVLNNVTVDMSEHLGINNSINVHLTDGFTGENSIFSLSFTVLFTLKFINPVGKTWAIDRLIKGQYIRQRIYFPSLISGPQHIFLKNISFYEPAIYLDQIINNYSLFERSFAQFPLNYTITGRRGLLVKIPYLIVGETCPSIIEYHPTQTLRVIVTDSVKMPLIGAEVRVFYFGKEYGTYISKNRTQPIAVGSTNENGEIILHNVPAGNYTVKAYKSGILLKESRCSTYKYINYVYTSYPHFPIWIIIFSSLNGIILIIGIIFYLKYKKTR